ncbi:5,10-methenyltetrahydrofolate synthetase [Quaeritorhiza haematococci]|nr:5,10-methenyltetrahydrofolate synthetase [Quaeritorhiza haematococci]
MEDLQTLPLNKFKIREPKLDDPREKALDKDALDLIIMPGLAFDQMGWRLGHGKGYYDRYLRQCFEWADKRNLPRPRTVALALLAQIVEGEVPHDEMDQKPEIVIGPDFVIEAK